MLENLNVYGLQLGGWDRDCGANSTGQSILFTSEKSACVIRPMRPEYHGLGFQSELDKRIQSHESHLRHLPNQVIPTDFAVVQAEDPDSGKGIEPALVKFMPKIANLKPITELEIGNLAKDPRVCLDVARINWGYLKMIARERVYPDQGYHEGSEDGVRNKLKKSLRSSNIMVGEVDGERHAFCDSDWTIDPDNPLVDTPTKKIKYVSKVVIKLAFYGAMGIKGQVEAKMKGLPDSRFAS